MLNYAQANICKTIADVNRGKRRPFEVDDFYLEFGSGTKKRQQSSDEIMSSLKAFAVQHNARWEAAHPNGG